MRPRRTRMIAAFAAAITALTFAVSPAQSGDDFVLGSGDVKASFLTVGPETAGLSVGVVVGETLADYQNDVARAQARAVNMRVIGTTATAEKCDGSDPDLHREDLPTTVRVDSREKGAPEGRTDYWPILPRDLPYHFDDAKEENGGFPNVDPGPDSPARADFSTLHARASGRPSSFSTSDSATAYIVGVGSASGGHTETATRIEDDRRVGEAKVTIPEISLGDGAVVFRDLEWSARQTTGPDAPGDATFEGNFRMGGVTVGGATYGWPDDTAAEFNERARSLLGLINTALAPTGLVVAFPEMNEGGGHASVTPLEVKVERPPLGREAFAMLPTEVYEARQEVFDRMIEANCRNATYISVGDIVAATPAGAGTTRLAFGGVDAFTEGTRFADPFAVAPSGTGSGFVAPASGGPTSSPGTPGSNQPTVTVPPGRPHTSDLAPPPPPDVLAAGDLSLPGTKSGTAAVVGMVGLIAVLGVALLDFFKPGRTLAGHGGGDGA